MTKHDRVKDRLYNAEINNNKITCSRGVAKMPVNKLSNLSIATFYTLFIGPEVDVDFVMV